MKPIRLEFSKPGAPTLAELLVGTPRSLFGRAGVAALLVAAAAAAGVGWEWMLVRQQLDATRSAIETSASRQRAGTVYKTSSLRPEAVRAWNQVVRHLNTPWSGLLRALEATTPAEIALVSIEPDAQQGGIRLQAEARSLDRLLNYAQQLEAHDLFSSVSLLKHETNEQDPLRPVRMTIAIRLRET